jgi:hypothetical protein
VTAGRGAPLELTREQILAFRRQVNGLDTRVPPSTTSLRRAAWAGLTDSTPRAAVLSLHARVEGTRSGDWERPAFVQVWGPRFSAYVVPAEDRAVFTVGRLPDRGPRRQMMEDVAERLAQFLHGRRMPFGQAGHAMGMPPNNLRYATATGTVLIRWDGARQPEIWTVPRPAVDPLEARTELVRRHVHVFGPTNWPSFSDWAGIRPERAKRIFEELAHSLVAVRTPVGDAWILADDEAGFRAATDVGGPARLLPSGDAYTLLWGADRELLVAEPRRRGELWTPRVWPGAVLLGGEIVGTWRRTGRDIDISPWRQLSPPERGSVEAEAATLPLPDEGREVRVCWDQ